MPDATPRISDDAFRLISGLVADYAGLYFAPERAQSFAQRLAPRLEATQCANFIDYYRLLKYDERSEIAEAIERLTNHETYFFRETAQLEFVAHLASKATKRLRVLSAGCSTGEEPYTLGMVLEQNGLAGRVEIVGIDISTTVVERAREASYTANSFRGVEGPMVAEYFMAEGGRMRLKPRTRRSASFERANLMDTEELEALGEFDAVLCRNVLIYFSPESKSKAIANLSDRLPENGYLLLGHSETLFDVAHDLEMVRAGSVIAHRRPASGQSRQVTR